MKIPVHQLLAMIRFSHTLFALPFALLSAALAWADIPFRWLDLLGIILCMVFARSFAMAFNRLVDWRYDALNPRTQGRHLPAGIIGPSTVSAFIASCAMAFVASTLIFWFREPRNPWPIILSVPVLLFIAGYSLAKRFTSLVHVWLGLSLMLAPMSAWIALRGFDAFEVPLLIGLAVCAWVAGFDILYACQDRETDRRLGLHSIPARFDIKTSFRIALVCHLLMIALLLALGLVSDHLGAIYFVGLAVITLILLSQHWLVRPSDLTKVNEAFFRVNAVVSLGLFGVVVVQLMVG